MKPQKHRNSKNNIFSDHKTSSIIILTLRVVLIFQQRSVRTTHCRPIRNAWVTTQRNWRKTRNSPMCGNEDCPLTGPLEPLVPAAVTEPCVAGVLALCRPSVRPLLLDGSAPDTAKPLASASAPSIGRKLNSSGLSWLALKPDSAAADDEVGAASRVSASLESGDGAGGGGDDRCSRGDWDVAGCGVAAVDCSTGWPAFEV